MALLSELLLIYKNLQTISAGFISNNDYVDNDRIAAAMTLVSNAVQVEEANEIQKILDGVNQPKIQRVIDKMGAVASAIDVTRTSVTSIVTIVTGVTNIVVDCSTGDFAAAVSVATGLGPTLHAVGINT